MKRIIGAVMGFGLWATLAPVQAESNATHSLPINQQVAEVAHLLTGVLSTAEQADQNPNAPRVEMTTCPVQVTDSGVIPGSDPVVFLYQEQALSSKPSQPYRQRFLKITPTPNQQQVESLSFKPTDLAPWVGFCGKPQTDRRIAAQNLGTPVCTIILERSPDGYHGKTPGEGCPANYRGAVRITNEIHLYPGGMETWDRGFDAQGKQIWGAEAEGYEFQKVSP